MIWFLVGYSLLFIVAWMLLHSLRVKLQKLEQHRNFLYESLYGMEYGKRLDSSREEK